MRYQSQPPRGGNNLLRPFYKWSDGFFDNYLKYCGPESFKRRAKKVKMTYKEEEEVERLVQGRKRSVPENRLEKDKSYLKGYFDHRSI